VTNHRNTSGIIAYFAQHRVAANLIMLMVIILGLMSIFSLKTQFFPDIKSNRLTASVIWPGANAVDIEDRITTPLESRIKQLEGVDSFRSNTNAGVTSIYVTYKNRVDMTIAEQKLTKTVENYSDYPQTAEKPTITLQNFRELIAVAVISTDGSVEDLKPYIREFRADLLARGISDVQYSGLRDHEIRVEVPTKNLVGLNTTIDRIASVVREKNQNQSSGTVGESFSSKAVKSKNKKKSPSALSQIVLSANQSGLFTTLGEIANVATYDVTGTRKVFFDNRPSVRLMMFRSTDIDTLESNKILDQWLKDVQPNLPKGITIQIPFKAAEFVIDNLKLLINNGIMGLILVTLMLFTFLNGKVALWAAWGIPVSIFGTLSILQLTGGSINFLSMFGMLMAMGIIVDDAIVVGEESVTLLEKGLDATESASQGAIRMFTPVLASSLTTVAAFSPLLFLEGTMGEVMRPVPVVVMSVIIASLVECFLIMPGHLNHSFKKIKKHPKKQNKFRLAVDQRLFAIRDGVYRRLITRALRNRGITISISLGAFAIAMGMVFFSVVKFVPDINPQGAVVTAWASFANGTSEAQIVEFGRKMESGLLATAKELDDSRDLIKNHYKEYSKDDRYVWIRVTLLDRDDRPFTNAQFLNIWDRHVDREVFVNKINISEDEEESDTKLSLSFFLAGNNLAILKEASRDLQAAIAKYPDLKNIADNIPQGAEQIVYELSPMGQTLGISPTDISTQIRGAIDGIKVQTFVDGMSETDLIVSLPISEKHDVNLLHYLPIRTPQGNVLPLGNIVKLRTTKTIEAIYHEEGMVGVRVTADILDPEADLIEISKSIKENELAMIKDRYGIQSEIRGSSQEEEKMIKRLMISFAVALALIYIILAWVFSSYSWPLVVMSAIPLGLTGAVFGHWIMGFDLNVLSVFGFFGLAGIVVNDSIILITRFQKLLVNGMAKTEAIIEACCQRFRAVLLTSVTTIVGLVPLLYETSVQAQLVQSMATSIAFGLSLGTVLVLVVIPVLLSTLESFKTMIRHICTRAF
jgi:multidrug efflux pump subunit AcrB